MTGTSDEDERWIRLCLELAERAAARGEVPVGAVVVRDGAVLGEGHNLCEARRDATQHAELVALRAAFAAVGEGRLPGAVLYCTLEPCFMCAGAALHARVDRIVYGARDPKFGACGSLAELPSDERLNHRCPTHGGVLADDVAALMRGFFRELRDKRPDPGPRG
jgi:tRNA(adenine34) deaminase